MPVSNRIRSILATLCIVLVAAALIGATVWTPGHERPTCRHGPRPDGARCRQQRDDPAPWSVRTGEFENGAPVYRLPAITVTPVDVESPGWRRKSIARR